MPHSHFHTKYMSYNLDTNIDSFIASLDDNACEACEQLQLQLGATEEKLQKAMSDNSKLMLALQAQKGRANSGSLTTPRTSSRYTPVSGNKSVYLVYLYSSLLIHHYQVF